MLTFTAYIVAATGCTSQRRATYYAKRNGLTYAAQSERALAQLLNPNSRNSISAETIAVCNHYRKRNSIAESRELNRRKRIARFISANYKLPQLHAMQCARSIARHLPDADTI